ncbi:DEAD/DEAH box helicase [Eubacterium sp. AB3007]|uniref:DEAD/DEAH box helicase n=1 Tax=Eubacterium sp. AB3007 TaxID=1392487 RepID=UPI0004864980|nr:DUF3427 domain-containing protein [Eubacterium sp. AB3007]
MLRNGIYEQIVNTRINRELAELDPEKYDIQLENLQAEDARKILTIYISYVIQKGLRYIRDSYPSREDAKALSAQIRLCNDIIEEVAAHTEEPDFRDKRILEKGEVLTALYEKLNSVRSISVQKVIRPETSIVENALFTGAPTEPSMMNELKREILSADSVDLLVSFIKWSAIRPLLTELRAFTARPEARLRVITTTYTRATDYKAIMELAKLPRTEVKINYETGHARMHAKSYLFHRETGFSTAYIGSSNLSNPALTGGLEWNVKVTEKESFDIVKKFSVSFESYWNDAAFERFDPEEEACRRKLQDELDRPQWEVENRRRLHMSFRPYAYQQEILDNLQAERENYGHYKNLVVAATGVGKTIVAAFDYKRFREHQPHARLLFVAHRKEILEQSIEKFQEVLNDFNFGELYVDGRKPSDIEHLFISVQSLNSARLTEWTSPDYYDFIIVDEFHHASAKSYQGLLTHYQPKILLGLTATPDRMDGEDILKYFDGRIASRMLLGEAIDRNLLSTFQYFGVTDQVDYQKLHWLNGRYDVRELESVYTADTARCQLVLRKVREYVADMAEVKGLGFCVSVAHAEYMARYFNEQGVPSIALSAQSIDDIRDDAKRRLVKGEIKFIFVVDLYNEGVDIPEVNTILFLRPTESATVFLQQLGRGLRIAEGKDCLTVLDFVGRANKRYKFAAKYEALVGKGRKSLRKQIDEGFSQLPKGCYIEFEKLAREHILDNLKQTDNTKSVLTEEVRTFQADTGLPLTLENFLPEHDLSLYDFYQNTGKRSLYRLMYWAGLLPGEEVLEEDRYTKLYARFNGLFHINSIRLLDYWIRYVKGNLSCRNETERLMRNMLYYTFHRKCPRKEGYGSIDEGINAVLDERFIREEVLQILQYNRSHVSFVAGTNEYAYVCPIDLHCSYNTSQIMAAFGYYNEEESPEFREGVKQFKDKKTDIFLINLNKSEKDFSPSTMYEDYAINQTLFHWQSQSQDKEQSPKIQRYIHHREQGSVISLFVREFKKFGAYTAPYVFLGNADYVSHQGEQPVSFHWRLHTPLPAELLPKANKTIAV